MHTPIIKTAHSEPGMLFDSPKDIQKPEPLHKARHDIRTAMHVVTGMSEVLTMASTLTQRETEIVAMIKRNADRAYQLIESVFDSLEQARDAAAPPAAGNVVCLQQHRRSKDAAAEAPPRSRALVVEDDESNALVISTLLEGMKYDCDVANSGDEALKKFAADHYEVVIMDVQMAGMDGLETARRIRKIENDNNLEPTPILAATGNATSDDRLFCARAGMTDYISKPFSRKDLEEKLLCALPLFEKYSC